MGVTIDDTTFKLGMKKLDKRVEVVIQKAVNDVANEVLRLSSFEVPHDKGMLQASGHTNYWAKFDTIVGYNKVYAARLHENPQYRFQKGRKGKYLEDPIKNNLRILNNFFEKAIANL